MKKYINTDKLTLSSWQLFKRLGLLDKKVSRYKCNYYTDSDGRIKNLFSGSVYVSRGAKE